MDDQFSNKILSPRRAFERDQFITRWLVLLVVLLGAFTLAAAPLLALSWKEVPFPGFVIEQTQVVANIDGTNWTGRSAGINYPERIISFGESIIESPRDLERAKWDYPPGHHVRIRTILPDGTVNDHRGIQMMEFPTSDLLRYFWLPYFIALVYFAIGFLVYLMRSQSPVGRTFTYFSVTAAIASALLFDLMTTHTGSILWTFAISQQGGALISLALLFPTPIKPVQERPWLRFLPYLVSMALAVWGALTITDLQNPWNYIIAWRYSYIYISIGILFFLVMMVARQQMIKSAIHRQQTRIVLLGGLLAFLPLAFWFGAPIFGTFIRWNPDIFLPFLLSFPLSIGVAILRYRLWDIEVLINRAMVYGAVTIILGIVFIVSVLGLQQIFNLITGSDSELAAVLSTIIIVTMFNPLRNRLQEGIDRRFYRRKYDAEKTLIAFSAALRDEVDLDKLSERLLNVLNETLEPNAAALILIERSEPNESASTRN